MRRCLYFENRCVNMFLLNIWSEYKNLIKRSKPFWGYKQYVDWISTKWNPQGHISLIYNNSMILFTLRVFPFQHGLLLSSASRTPVTFFFFKHSGKLGWSSICLRFSQLSLKLCLMVCLFSNLILWSDIAFDMDTAMVSLIFEMLWAAYSNVFQLY